MIKKDFATIVKTHREQMGLSQQQLAELTGLTRDSIKHIENEQQNVFLEQALKISAVLNINVDDLKDVALPKFELDKV